MLSNKKYILSLDRDTILSANTTGDNPLASVETLGKKRCGKLTDLAICISQICQYRFRVTQVDFDDKYTSDKQHYGPTVNGLGELERPAGTAT